MVVEIRVRGSKKLNARLKQVSLNLNTKLAPGLVKKGYDFALKTMPSDTGSLRRALMWTSNKRSGKLIQKQPKHPDGRNRPYHMWMARISAPTINADGKRHVYNDVEHVTSKTRYMEKTYKYMSKEAPNEVKKNVNEAFKGF